jgi:hypothetical protein
VSVAYHDRNPWQEPQRTRRAGGRIVLGCILAVAVFIVLAVIEVRAALIVAGLAIVTALAFAISGRRRRQ